MAVCALITLGGLLQRRFLETISGALTAVPCVIWLISERLVAWIKRLNMLACSASCNDIIRFLCLHIKGGEDHTHTYIYIYIYIPCTRDLWVNIPLGIYSYYIIEMLSILSVKIRYSYQLIISRLLHGQEFPFLPHSLH